MEKKPTCSLLLWVCNSAFFSEYEKPRSAASTSEFHTEIAPRAAAIPITEDANLGYRKYYSNNNYIGIADQRQFYQQKLETPAAV